MVAQLCAFTGSIFFRKGYSVLTNVIMSGIELKLRATTLGTQQQLLKSPFSNSGLG